MCVFPYNICVHLKDVFRQSLEKIESSRDSSLSIPKALQLPWRAALNFPGAITMVLEQRVEQTFNAAAKQLIKVLRGENEMKIFEVICKCSQGYPIL